MGFVSKKRGTARRLVLTRRGNITHESYFAMFQLLWVIMVVLTLLQYTKNVATDLGFEKRFTSIDLALITTTVFYSPGTVKYMYFPIEFPVSIIYSFRGNLVNVKEPSEELNMLYWFLSDRNMENLSATVHPDTVNMNSIGPFNSYFYFDVLLKKFGKDGIVRFSSLDAPVFTFYKSGGKLSFRSAEANALQQSCPLINTSSRELKKLYVAKVFANKADFSDESKPANRLAQALSARYPIQMIDPSSATPTAGAGSAVSAIPPDGNIIIVLGDAGEGREAGSLILYFPIDSNTLKARKLACLLLNDLLTLETTVLYAQLMPIYADSLDEKSPLRVFKEISNPEQLMVFIDVSKFSADQIDMEAASDAIYRGISRYYGSRVAPQPRVPTLSYTVLPSPAPQTGEGTQGGVV
jgi:hypothetical protein